MVLRFCKHQMLLCSITTNNRGWLNVIISFVEHKQFTCTDAPGIQCHHAAIQNPWLPLQYEIREPLEENKATYGIWLQGNVNA